MSKTNSVLNIINHLLENKKDLNKLLEKFNQDYIIEGIILNLTLEKYIILNLDNYKERLLILINEDKKEIFNINTGPILFILGVLEEKMNKKQLKLLQQIRNKIYYENDVYTKRAILNYPEDTDFFFSFSTYIFLEFDRIDKNALNPFMLISVLINCDKEISSHKNGDKIPDFILEKILYIKKDILDSINYLDRTSYLILLKTIKAMKFMDYFHDLETQTLLGLLNRNKFREIEEGYEVICKALERSLILDFISLEEYSPYKEFKKSFKNKLDTILAESDDPKEKNAVKLFLINSTFK